MNMYERERLPRLRPCTCAQLHAHARIHTRARARTRCVRARCRAHSPRVTITPNPFAYLASTRRPPSPPGPTRRRRSAFHLDGFCESSVSCLTIRSPCAVTPRLTSRDDLRHLYKFAREKREKSRHRAARCGGGRYERGNGERGCALTNERRSLFE